MTGTAQADQLLVRSMQPVVDAVGFDAAIALVARWGGVTITLRSDPHCPVPQAIGAEAARTLETALGRGAMQVPRCLSWLLARRNEEIVARSLFGETHADLALRFKLTERQIRRILVDAEVPAPPTTDLFSATEGASQ